MCEPRHQHVTSVNSEDYRDRRCIARVPLLGQEVPSSILFLALRMLYACSLLLFVSVFPSRRRFVLGHAQTTQKLSETLSETKQKTKRTKEQLSLIGQIA